MKGFIRSAIAVQLKHTLKKVKKATCPASRFLPNGNGTVLAAPIRNIMDTVIRRPKISKIIPEPNSTKMVQTEAYVIEFVLMDEA